VYSVELGPPAVGRIALRFRRFAGGECIESVRL
jgi:hypothetical protein